MPQPFIPLTIPSLHDETPLECRIHLPNRPHTLRGAVILAHPYAPLGGSLNDPVIAHIKSLFLRRRCLVATFNFRGAGKSGEKTSWSAGPEVRDYETVLGFVCSVFAGIVRSRGGNGKGVRVVLGGYSYGSMVASRVGPAQEVYESFVRARDGVVGRVAGRAREFAEQHLTMTTNTNVDEEDEEEDEERDSMQFTTSYLLISPLLPPLTTALSLSWKTLWNSPAQLHDALTKHDTLAIHGTNDMFTSVAKLRTWAATLASLPASRFEAREVEGAGHFWREEGVLEEMLRAIEAWLEVVDEGVVGED